MNRTLGLPTLLLVMLATLPARGQVPLIVGSVRDQGGAPIVGATVTGITPAGATPVATTDGAGTFALRAAGITAVSITCRYCRSETLPVQTGVPVVAVILRYAALFDESPSPADLANLPYANVESSIGLRPFTLLAQTSAPYPGATLSDRGLSATGSLLVDDGAPNYDIVSGASPYGSIPASYEQSATVHDATNAYLYGNQAEGGIIDLTPFSSGSSPEVVTVGSDVIARAQSGSDAQSIAVGTFSNNQESRQRADLAGTWPIGGDQSLSFAGGTERGQDFGSSDLAYANSFTFAGATFNDPRALNLYVSAIADRGDYAINEESEYPISETWSDSGLTAGIRSTGAVVGFVDVGVRTSTGLYDAQGLPAELPRLAATLAQSRADAGLEVKGNAYDVVAGVGAFWINYAGGTYGASHPARTSLGVPSIDAKLFPNGKLTLELQSSGSFTLPTFVQQYLYTWGAPTPVLDERNALTAGILSYTDGSRLRLEFEQASQSTNGAATGNVTSSGIAGVWQIAPALALRAWTMHVTDTVPLYAGGLPYNGIAPTVNALWMTYEGQSTIRADLIYRRDLLDAAPFYHVDGAISGPIGYGLRWYAGAEDRMRRTFVDAGIRFNGR